MKYAGTGWRKKWMEIKKDKGYLTEQEVEEKHLSRKKYERRTKAGRRTRTGRRRKTIFITREENQKRGRTSGWSDGGGKKEKRRRSVN